MGVSSQKAQAALLPQLMQGWVSSEACKEMLWREVLGTVK